MSVGLFVVTVSVVCTYLHMYMILVKVYTYFVYLKLFTVYNTWAVRKVSSHFEYLENPSLDLDVTW